jgi:type III secretory pathway component EscU
MELKSKKIIIYWLAGSVLVSALSVLIAVTYLTINGPLHVPGEEIVGEIIGNFLVAILILPIGLLISLLLPWGWVSIGCLIWATRKKAESPLIGSFIVAFIFGLFWPNIFFTMMSV